MKITSLYFANFIFIICCCLNFTSQDRFHSNFLDSVLTESSNGNKYRPLNKSVPFFIQKEWDSVLVFSSKEVHNVKPEINNFLHYMRAFSFMQKKLFNASQKEFNKVSSNFPFYELVTINLGFIALEQKMYDNSILHYNKLLNLPNYKYRYVDKMEVLTNLGLCYLYSKDYEKAKFLLEEHLQFSSNNKDNINCFKANCNLGNLYYEQYKDDLAIPYFEKAYQISKIIDDFNIRQGGAENMAVVEENRKNYKKALAYRKEAEQWKDSLNNQNKIYEVAQLEKQFAVKQKQQEVDLLQIENKAKETERNGLLYSALVLLMLLGVTFYFYKEKNKTNKIIVAQKETLDALNATKDKLFSIVSHDLRSSVNALKTSNTKLVSNLEAKNLEVLDDLLQRNSGIVNGAYNLLDNLLHWALLQTKQSYFHIEPLRLFFIVEQVAYNYMPIMQDKGITFTNTVQKTTKVDADQESLKIVLRNFLDNAIKFSKAAGEISIYSEEDDTHYNLIIADTGLGMSAAKIDELLKDSPTLAKKDHEDIIGTGLGLELCKSYIKKNNGTLSIESTLGKGTKMIVSLPKTV